MSAPDPKAWEVTNAELDEAITCSDDSDFPEDESRQSGGCYCSTDCRNVRLLSESVARRRALAELRALAVSLDEDERGTHDTQDGLTEAWREVCARIAEIEAEETSQPSASAQTATP